MPETLARVVVVVVVVVLVAVVVDVAVELVVLVPSVVEVSEVELGTELVEVLVEVVVELRVVDVVDTDTTLAQEKKPMTNTPTTAKMPKTKRTTVLLTITELLILDQLIYSSFWLLQLM